MTRMAQVFLNRLNKIAKCSEQGGCFWLTAYDGEEAVAAAAVFRPRVILLDIGLPKLTGYETCRRIREQKDGMSMIIIAQTGWGQAEDRQRTRDAGFDHHMVKPVDLNELQKLLAELQATE